MNHAENKPPKSQRRAKRRRAAILLALATSLLPLASNASRDPWRPAATGIAGGIDNATISTLHTSTADNAIYAGAERDNFDTGPIAESPRLFSSTDGASWSDVTPAEFATPLAKEITCISSNGTHTWFGTGVAQPLSGGIYRKTNTTYELINGPLSGFPQTGSHTITAFLVFDTDGGGTAPEHLYATTANAAGGQLWRTETGDTDYTDNASWELLLDLSATDNNNTAITAIEAWNSGIYVGTENTATGSQIYTALTSDLTTWNKVAASNNGFNTGATTSINSLVVHNEELYAGTTNNAGAGLWRSNNGIDWADQIQPGLGLLGNESITSIASHAGRLWIAFSNSASLGNQIWKQLASGEFTQSNDDGFGDTDTTARQPSFTIFNDILLWGGGNASSGVEIWRNQTAAANWRLDEVSGLHAMDSIGSSTGSVSGKFTWARDTAAPLDGGNGSINLHGASIEFDPGSALTELTRHPVGGECTISAWIRPRDINQGVILDATNGAAGFRLELEAGGLKVTANGGTATSTPTLSEDVWAHVAVTSDGTELKMYVNGIPAQNTLTESPAAPIAASAPTIGSAVDLSSGFLDATIDQFVLYDYELTATEITTQSGFHVPEIDASIMGVLAQNFVKNGDTIIVAPGEYGEQLSLDGKRVSIIASGGPTRTSITPPSGTAVEASSGSTTHTKLIGFSITGGHAEGDFGGGGVFVSDGLTLQGCWISNNESAKAEGTGGNGGGVFVDNGGHLIVDQCVISGNSAEANGGGLFQASGGRLSITSSRIAGNRATESGGGLYCSADLSQPNSTVIVNNTVVANHAAGDGSGLWIDEQSSSIVTNNLFWGNDVHAIIATNDDNFAEYDFNVNELLPTGTVGNNNMTSDPKLRVTRNLSWTKRHSFDFQTGKSTLLNNSRYLSPNTLIGQLVKLTFGSESIIRPIVGNSRTAIEIIGDVSEFCGTVDTTAPLAGLIDTNTATGSDGTYNTTPSGGNGSGLEVSVSVTGGSVTGLTATTSGSQYLAGDELTISGSAIGSATDITFTLTAGSIVAWEDYELIDLRIFDKDSSLIDVGTDNTFGLPTSDWDNEPRIHGTKVDVGADEFIDQDNDDIPDRIEVMLGLDALVHSSNNDTDGDGIQDWYEFLGNSAILSSRSAPAGNLFVDVGGNDGNEGDHEHPLLTIQAAIDKANDGDVIVIRAGTYSGLKNVNLDTNGLDILIRGEEGPENVVIDGGGSNQAFVFNGGESERCTIMGLTLKNCKGTSGGAISIAGNSSPTLVELIFDQCEATANGGAVAVLSGDPIIRRCDFNGNKAVKGGAITIANNTAFGKVDSCRFQANEATGRGGAIHVSNSANPEMVNCIIGNGNTANLGGGIANEGGALSIIHSTIANNDASNNGGGVYNSGSTTTILNTIVWGNTANNSGPAIHKASGTVNISNSVIEGGFAGGTNIAATDPLFSDPQNGDFGLEVGSSAINIGNAANQTARDFEDAERVGDPDAGAREFTEFFIDGSYGPNDSNGSPAKPFKSLKEAFSQAGEGAIFTLADGTYSGPDNRDLNFGGMDIVIRSSNGPDGVIIDCESFARAFTFENEEDGNCRLEGLTLINGDGSTSVGGLILISNYAEPEIVNCRLANSFISGDGAGIGITNGANPIILDSIITSCFSGGSGGAISIDCANAEIVRCIFTANNASTGGAISLVEGSMSVLNSIICGNEAGDGGAIFIGDQSESNILHTTITDNMAYGSGSGIHVKWGGDAFIANSILVNVGSSDILGSGVINAVSSSTAQGFDNGANGNDAAIPTFRPQPTGTLTTPEPAFDSPTGTTTLTDTGASFVPGSLTGLLLNPDTNQNLTFLVIGNTATEITVLGDALATGAASTSTYALKDYHLTKTSAGVNTADSAYAPTVDVDRIERYDGSPDRGADEFTEPTIKNVAAVTPNGTYGTGPIDIELEFFQNVNVTVGATPPKVTLETGTTDAIADYVSGSGTARLQFQFMIQPGMTSSDLATVNNSLTVNDSLIVDAIGNTIDLGSLPNAGGPSSLDVNADIEINTTPPGYSFVSINSNNANGNFAKVGDVVTLAFTIDTALQSNPIVMIDGKAPDTLNNTSGNAYEATRIMKTGDTEGPIGFSIDVTATNGISSNRLTTTDSTTVEFDETAPTLSNITIFSSNAVSNRAKTGDTTTVQFDADEAIKTPSIEFLGSPADTVTEPFADQWQGTRIMQGGDPAGMIPFTINFSDLAGNPGTIVTATNDSSTVEYDKSTDPPTLPKPLGNTTYSSPVDLTFTLPEAPLPNSVKLTFNGVGNASVITLDLEDATAGSSVISTIDPTDPAASPAVMPSETDTIPDGEWNVTLSYQDEVGNTANSATVNGVTIDTSTQAPTLTSPAMDEIVGQAFTVAFTIPEVPLPGSVILKFTAEETAFENELTLIDVATSNISFTLNANNPTDSAKVVAETQAGIPAGRYTVQISYQDAQGNPSEASSNSGVIIDATAPPAPSRPDLFAADDSGHSDSDDVTNVTTPEISGTAEEHAEIEVISDIDGILGTALADELGNWALTIPEPAALSEGVHQITAVAKDEALNIGPTSPALQLTIDLSAPEPPVFDTAVFTPDSDHGTTNDDGITNTLTPRTQGNAEPFSLVEVHSSIGGALVGVTDLRQGPPILVASLDDAETLTGLGGVFNGAPNAAVHGTIPGTLGSAVGIVGEARTFDGTAANHVTFGDTFNMNTDSITVSIWFNVGAADTNSRVLISDGNQQSTITGWSINLSPSSADKLVLRAAFAGDNDGSERLGLQRDYQKGVWNHVAMIIDNGSGTVTGFYNGLSSGVSGTDNGWQLGGLGAATNAFPAGSDFHSSNDLMIGRNAMSGLDFPLIGQVDEVSIWNRALAPIEAEEIHESGISGNNVRVPVNLSEATQNLTATATDLAGNTSVASSARSVVIDATAPTISCPPNVNAQCIAPTPITDNGDFTAAGGVLSDETSIDLASFVHDSDSSDRASNPETVNRTYLVMDTAGNSSSCVQQIVIQDTTKPSFNDCPSPINVNNDTGDCGAVVTFTAPTATDDCDGPLSVTQTSGPLSGSLFPVGTSTVTFSATDLSGNSETCSFDITVTDMESPTVVCPSNQQTGNDFNVCGAIVNFTTPTPGDNCVGATAVVSSDGPNGETNLVSGSVFPVGLTTMTVTATDAAGNQSNCQFTIEVFDEQIVWNNDSPPNISVPVDAGHCGAVVTYTTPSATGACGGAWPVELESGLASGSFFPVGTTVVEYLVDEGETDLVSFSVTVTDNEDPVISCPADIDIECSGDEPEPYADFAAFQAAGGSASDICGLNVASFNLFEEDSDGGPCPETITRTYQIFDVNGNSAMCTQEIIIEDTTEPTLICPTDASIPCLDDLPDPFETYTAFETAGGSASDNCFLDEDSFQFFGDVQDGNIITRTYEIGDECGNTTTCEQLFTITDSVLPTIICPANIEISNDPETCGAVVTYTAPVGTDNCSGATTIRTAGPASGSTFPVGITTVTHLVTDAEGNTADCSFTITVFDDDAPTFTSCPSDVTTTAEAGQCGAVVTYTFPTAMDNCDGTITPTLNTGLVSGASFPVGETIIDFIARDAAGNEENCSFTVTVTDDEAPAIICPANVTVVVAPEDTDGHATIPLPTVSDNCDPAPIIFNDQMESQDASGSYPLGTTTVTFTAQDADGNFADCTMTVTVIEGAATDADLRVSQTVPPSAFVDSFFDITYLIENLGPADADTTTVQITLPDTLTIDQVTVNGGLTPTTTTSGGNINIEIVALSLSSVQPINVTVHASGAAAGLITSQVTASSTTPDPITANDTNSDNFSLQVFVPNADLSGQITPPASPTVDSFFDITYELNVLSGDPVSNARALVRLPATVQIDSITLPNGASSTTSPSSEVIEIEIVQLDLTSGPATIVVRTGTNLTGLVQTELELPQTDLTDPIPSNNLIQESFTVLSGAPASWEFIQQPTTVPADAFFDVFVELRLLDQFGNLATTSTRPVTLAIGQDPNAGNSELAGNGPRTPINGSIQFPHLRMRHAGSNFTLVASATDLPAIESSPFDVHALGLALLAPPINGNSGSFRQLLAPRAGEAPRVLAVADFNGNGRDQILAEHPLTQRLTLIEVNDDASTSTTQLPASLTNFEFIGIGDFNGDDTTDLIGRDRISGTTSIQFLDGPAIIGSVSLSTIDFATMEFVGTGRFDSNNADDLVLRDRSTGTQQVILWDGSVIGNTLALPSSLDGLTIADVVDFDLDGRSDFLMYDASPILWEARQGASQSATVDITAVDPLNGVAQVPLAGSVVGGSWHPHRLTPGNYHVLPTATAGSIPVPLSPALDVSRRTDTGATLNLIRFSPTPEQIQIPIDPKDRILAQGDFNGDGIPETLIETRTAMIQDIGAWAENLDGVPTAADSPVRMDALIHVGIPGIPEARRVHAAQTVARTAEDHAVYPFYMGETAITVEQYVAFLNAERNDPQSSCIIDGTGTVFYGNTSGVLLFDPSQNNDVTVPDPANKIMFSYEIRYTSSAGYTYDETYATFPIMGVTWYGAVKYCNWLAQVRGLAAEEHAFSEGSAASDWHPAHLTQSEWADGFDDLERLTWQMLYPHAPRLPMDNNSATTGTFNEYRAAAAPNGQSYATADGGNYWNSLDFFDNGPTPGFYYAPNAFGLFDLSGNSWEWQVDTETPGTTATQAARGGSWFNYQNHTETNFRFGIAPNRAFSDVGFRYASMTNCIIQAEIATDAGFATVIEQSYSGASDWSDLYSWSPSLSSDTRYFWRYRWYCPGLSASWSDWTSGGTFRTTDQSPTSQTITPNTGWTMTSLAIDPGVAHYKHLFGMDSTVWIWDSVAQQYVRPFALRAYDAFWLMAPAAGTARSNVVIPGFSPESSVVTLRNGWNLIGPRYDDTPLPTNTAIRKIQRYENDSFRDTTDLDKGKAYWIFSNSTVLLNLDVDISSD